MKKMEDWELFNYLADKADPVEISAIENWLEADPSNREKLEQIRELWKYTDSIEELESVNIKEDWNNVRERMEFGKDAGNMDNINHGKRILPFNLNVYPLLKIAALIVLILIPAILLERRFDFFGTSGNAWISEASEEMQRELILPDGSAITLNIHSEISYPGQFDENQREVRLKGEAFFDVVSSDEQAFLIYTESNIVIEVVGTSFNVLSREGAVVVQVVSGMVSLYQKGKEKDIILLREGEMGSHDASGFSSPDPAIPNDVSWVTGKLIFKNTLLGEVVSDLSRYSGKEFIIRGEGMDELVLTSTYENQELTDILDEIRLVLDIEYSVSDDTIVLHPAAE